MYAIISPSEPSHASRQSALAACRVEGAAAIGFGPANGPTRLSHLYHRAPLRVLFPRVSDDDLPMAVLANTAGGVVGGDRLSVSVEAFGGSRFVVTTQAAEKVYRSAGADSRVETRLVVEEGAWLEWLPQEAILFDGARLRRSIAVDLAPGARLLACEMLVFGRSAHGERFTRGLLRESWRVERAGRLAWADALRLDGDVAARIDSAPGFAGAVATATVVYAADDAAERLDMARALLADVEVRVGATLVGGLLLARFLAQDAQALRRDLARFLGAWRAAVAGLPDRVPRLWHI